MRKHLCAQLCPPYSLRTKWVVAKRTPQACRASKTTSKHILATRFVNLKLFFFLSTHGFYRYAKTTTSSLLLVHDLVPLPWTFHINWQWQSNDTLTIWPFLEESLLIVCFIFSRHLTTDLGCHLIRVTTPAKDVCHNVHPTIFVPRLYLLYTCLIIAFLFCGICFLPGRDACSVDFIGECVFGCPRGST